MEVNERSRQKAMEGICAPSNRAILIDQKRAQRDGWQWSDYDALAKVLDDAYAKHYGDA